MRTKRLANTQNPVPTASGPTIDQYWEELEPHLPRFSREEQRAAVALYRELAKGQAVDGEHLARALEISVNEAWALLAQEAIRAFIYADQEGRVIGFGGLAVSPNMHHRFEVDGRNLSTWCASSAGVSTSLSSM